MKSILTILLLASLGVMGQSKALMNWPMNADTTSSRFVFIDVNKSDTTECWFKAAFIISDTEVYEKWIKGYIVKQPNKPVLLSTIASYRQPSNEYFLWPDKRRFNHTVIAIIEK